jgi:hypothetical protein
MNELDKLSTLHTAAPKRTKSRYKVAPKAAPAGSPWYTKMLTYGRRLSSGLVEIRSDCLWSALYPRFLQKELDINYSRDELNAGIPRPSAIPDLFWGVHHRGIDRTFVDNLPLNGRSFQKGARIIVFRYG